jgi:hypothetical protein
MMKPSKRSFIMTAISANRVSDNTSPISNRRIQRHTEIRVDYYSRHPDEIDQRLRELDEEWDIERLLETGAAAITLASVVLGVGVNRKFLLVTLGLGGFFMQHALQGWAPPLPLLRRLGVRTQYEIERERYALKAVRGDFQESTDPEAALQAVRV